MRICVVGAGAIGGLMGAKLALAGEDVSVIDQGEHLKAIQKNGLKLIWEDGSEHMAKNIKAMDRIVDAGPQDLVILALKAHYLENIAADVSTLIGPDTMVMTVQNGIPWWYFHNHGGEFDGHRLNTLDPNGVLGRHIDGDRIVGCVVYPAADVPAPGVIHHVEGDRFPIGELDGSESDRIKSLFDVLVNCGFRSRILDNIRAEIWLKAWGNLSFNPISSLSHATLEDICKFPETRKLAENMMSEAQNIANKLGIEFRHTIEKRIAGAESVGAHKTSMLQDVEAGRSLEVEALIGSILELGNLTGCESPNIGAIYACVKLLNNQIEKNGMGVAARRAA
ncbi:ketopantoate reductase family protein [Pseudomonadota bacterium]